MNKLTKIQFTTFIDIISQDNYRGTALLRLHRTRNRKKRPHLPTQGPQRPSHKGRRTASQRNQQTTRKHKTWRT